MSDGSRAFCQMTAVSRDGLAVGASRDKPVAGGAVVLSNTATVLQGHPEMSLLVSERRG